MCEGERGRQWLRMGGSSLTEGMEDRVAFTPPDPVRPVVDLWVAMAGDEGVDYKPPQAFISINHLSLFSTDYRLLGTWRFARMGK